MANQPFSLGNEIEVTQTVESHPLFSFNQLPFIGRKEELTELDNYLKDSSSAQGRIVLLLGEPGIGKSRFASEVARRAKRSGFRCLEAKCRNDVVSPLLPWIQYVTQFCKSATADLFFKVCRENFEQIVRLVPDLSENIRLQSPLDADENKNGASPAKTGNPGDTMQQEMQFIIALNQVFSRLSENSPLLLILDDMQWCDTSSLRLIEFLISNSIRNSRILLLCLLRDSDLTQSTNQAVIRFIETLRGQASSRFINLTRFAEDNVKELIEEVFPGTRDDSMNELCARLYSRTRGNPLFLSELLKSLLEQQVISKNDLGRWACSGRAQNFQIPETIRSVIEQRIELLDKPTLSMLQLTSVIGEQFSIQTLDQLIGQRDNRDQFHKSLETALKSGLILEREPFTMPPCYTFSDESVREVLYDQIDPSQKKTLHLIVARAVEPLLDHGKSFEKPRLSELANHFLRGGDLMKAKDYFIQAGKSASQLYAHTEALADYQAALELLGEETSVKDSPQLSLEKADLLTRSGDESQFLPQVEKTLDSWNCAAELYGKCGEKLKAANLLAKIGVFYQLVMYNLQASEAVLERSLTLAKEHDNAPSPELARITAWTLVTDIWRGDRKKVIERSAIAMELAEKTGAYDVIAMLDSYSIAAYLVDEVEEAIESCDRGLKIAEEHGLLFEACYNYFHKASAYNYTYGPSAKSRELYLEGLNFTASKRDFMVNLFNKVEVACGVYLPLGDWKRARELAEDSIASTHRFPKTSLFNLIAESAMGQVLLHEGNFAKAREYLEYVRDMTKGFGVLQLDVPLYIALARLNIGTKNFEEAQRNLEMGYRLSKRRGLTVINGIPHIELLDLMIEFSLMRESGRTSEDEQMLQDTLEEMIRSSKKINQPWTLAYVRRVEALVAQHRNELEKAETLFQESIRTFEKLGWPYERAKTEYHLGVAYLRRGKLLMALDSFDSACELFSRLGARSDLEKITLLKKEIEDKCVPLLERRPKFESSDTRIVFETLITEFWQDFLIKRLEIEKCGWRNMSELQKLAKLSKYSLYGRNRGMAGPVLRELLSSGVVESRMFEGERGRGGEIMKLRVSFRKNEKNK